MSCSDVRVCSTRHCLSGFRLRVKALAGEGRTWVYRGLYQWDGAQQAEDYARALWRVLALVSVRDSIRYHVLPGLQRDDLLRNPELSPADEASAWWRLTTAPVPVT
jgi:hypothetical protein